MAYLRELNLYFMFLMTHLLLLFFFYMIDPDWETEPENAKTQDVKTPIVHPFYLLYFHTNKFPSSSSFLFLSLWLIYRFSCSDRPSSCETQK